MPVVSTSLEYLRPRPPVAAGVEACVCPLEGAVCFVKADFSRRALTEAGEIRFDVDGVKEEEGEEKEDEEEEEDAVVEKGCWRWLRGGPIVDSAVGGDVFTSREDIETPPDTDLAELLIPLPLLPVLLPPVAGASVGVRVCVPAKGDWVCVGPSSGVIIGCEDVAEAGLLSVV